MKTAKIYEAERTFIKRKFPALNCTWETRELIEQLVTPLLEASDADYIYQKLNDGLKIHAKLRLGQLVQLIEVDKRRSLYRVVISIKELRRCCADELTDTSDGGGSGGAKNRLNPLNRFGRF